MTGEMFRRAALALPDVIESAHMDHPDFRVAGKVFATLGYPDQAWGMVKLPPGEQQQLIEAMPDAFTPAAGAWGRGGGTLVRLAQAKPDIFQHALRMAWELAHLKQTARKRTARKT